MVSLPSGSAITIANREAVGNGDGIGGGGGSANDKGTTFTFGIANVGRNWPK